MSSLILDDFLNRNPDSIVIITHDRLNIRLVGLLNDSQVVQALSAQYGNSIWGGAGSVGGSVSNYGSTVGGKKGGFASAMGSTISAMSSYATSQHTLMGTVKTYEGSGELNLPVSMTCFFDWAGNPDMKKVDKWLNFMTQPKVNIGSLLGSNLYEPDDLLELATLNVNLFEGKLLNVMIGSWLFATDVYATSLNKNYLANTDEDGKPIAVQLSFQINPYRQLSAEELTNWLI